MAENNQFMAIVGKHPEILKAMKEAEERVAKRKAAAEEAAAKGETVPEEPRFNPFNRVKKTQTQQQPSPYRPPRMPIPPTPMEQQGWIKDPETGKWVKPDKSKIKQVVVVEEEDNDPVLETVAAQSEGETLNPDVTVKTMKKTVITQRQTKADIKEEKPAEQGKQSKTVPIVEESAEEEPVEKKVQQETKVEPKKEEAKDVTVTTPIPEEEEEREEILTPAYFLEHVDELKQRYFYEDLDQLKHSLCERISAITIPNDINMGMAKVRIAEIDQLRNEILERRIEIKMLYECPFENRKGDIAVAARAQAKGNSEGERDRSFCAYLKDFPVKDGTVNMAYIRTILGMYNTVFDNAIVELVAKRQSLILTFSGFKIDASLA